MKSMLHLHPKWWEMSIVGCFGVMPALLIFLLFRGQGNNVKPLPQDLRDWRSPSVEITQLPSENGVIPVEIHRAKAHFKSSNDIDDIMTIIKNNTDKNILAISLQITVTSETEGNKFVKSNFLTRDSFLHEDVQQFRKTKPFMAKDVLVMESNSMTYSVDTLVKHIAVKIDYVEFSDATGTGPDDSGSRIISQIRAGATKYKAWLAEKYIRADKSAATILSAIEDAELPSELKIESGYESQGANAYQRYLREKYQLHGMDEITKHFNKLNQ